MDPILIYITSGLQVLFSSQPSIIFLAFENILEFNILLTQHLNEHNFIGKMVKGHTSFAIIRA